MKYKLEDNIVMCEVEETINLLSLDNDEKIYKLKGVSGVMFQLLNDGFDDSDVVSKVSKEFDVESQVVLKDLNTLINSLKSHKIIQEQ